MGSRAERDGTQSEDQLNFTVAPSGSCPLNPAVPSLTFCNPLNAAVAKSPLTVQAQANDTLTVASIQLFVDGKLQTTVAGSSNSFTTTLTLAPGVHRISAQGKDSYNAHVSATTIVRVSQ